jgi:hypothetical protein
VVVADGCRSSFVYGSVGAVRCDKQPVNQVLVFFDGE